jgi:hypothetical protein
VAYSINKTDGSVFAVVADGTINTNSSLTLFGKNYPGYGEFLNENLVRLLENHADTIPATNPLAGQLWFDKTETTLKVYNGSEFKKLGGAISSDAAPDNASSGDIWWDTLNKKLYVWDEADAAWVFIGGSAGSGFGLTGAIPDVITDTALVDHPVVKLYVDDVLVSIFSGDPEFTPNDAIAGFTTVKQGQTLSNTLVSAMGDSGLLLGNGKDLAVSVSGTTTRVARIKNQTANGTIVVGTNATPDAMTMASNGNVTYSSGVFAMFFAGDGNALTNLNASNVITGTLPNGRLSGAYTGLGSITPALNETSDLGSGLLRWKTVYTQTITASDFTGGAFTGNGAGITALNAANLASGVVPNARLAGSYTSLGAIAPALGDVSDLGTAAYRWRAAYAQSVTADTFTGGTYTGNVILLANPTLPLAASPKQYTDTKLALSGGTMTGSLVLNADPTEILEAVTKQYADTKLALTGGVMTGTLILAADPTNALGAATKQYVDTAVNNNQIVITYGFAAAVTPFSIFPPAGKTMANLIGFIPSIRYFAMNNTFNSGDLYYNTYTIYADRVTIYGYITAGDVRGTTNYLAIWR